MAGTVADDRLLDSATTSPPAGAAPFKVTVPVSGFPPTTDPALKDTDTWIGLMVSVCGPTVAPA